MSGSQEPFSTEDSKNLLCIHCGKPALCRVCKDCGKKGTFEIYKTKTGEVIEIRGWS